MVTSSYEWKILEWDDKLETNKQTNKQPFVNSHSTPYTRSFSVSYLNLCLDVNNHLSFPDVAEPESGMLLQSNDIHSKHLLRNTVIYCRLFKLG